MDNVEKGYWIIANQKHLSVFKEDAQNIDEYESTVISGKAGLFLAQIRGHGRLSLDQAVKLARKAQISKVMLVDSILPKLKKATEGRIDYTELTPKGITEIEEHIDTETTLFVATSKFHEGLNPTDIDLGSLETLSHTAKLPRSESEIKTLLMKLGMSESQSINCIKIQGGFELVKIFEKYSLSEPILFNEYIWRCDQSKIAHGLSNFNPDQKQIIESIVGMGEGYQGHPMESFKDYQDILNVADSVGLIDSVEIKTKDGIQKSFMFTPHLRSEENPSAFSNDLLGDVKLFLASMSFGEHYSKISRLGDANREKTIHFIQKLIRNREAGDATAIGIDYVMLEEHGIIKVEPTNTAPGGRYKMVLLRPEIAQLALKAIKTKDVLEKHGILPLSGFRTKSLGEGTYFTDVEGTRIQEKPYAKLPKESQESTNYYLKKLRGEG